MTEKAFDTGTKSPLDIFPNPFCIISSLNWLQIPHNVVFQQFMVFRVQTSSIKYLKYGIGILLRWRNDLNVSYVDYSIAEGKQPVIVQRIDSTREKFERIHYRLVPCWGNCADIWESI